VGRKKKVRGRRPPEPKRSGAVILAALGVLVLAAVGTWVWLGRQDPLAAAPVYAGGPRLAVDTDTIDFGAVRFEKMVTATFRLKNVGDQTLTLAANPPVEVVEGC
jgi:hypothetical protein